MSYIVFISDTHKFKCTSSVYSLTKRSWVWKKLHVLLVFLKENSRVLVFVIDIVMILSHVKKFLP